MNTFAARSAYLLTPRLQASLWLALGVFVLNPSPASAQQSADAAAIQQLKDEVNALKNQVQDLQQRQTEDNGGHPAPLPKNAAIVTAGSDGFDIHSADKQFDLHLKGLLQAQDREFITPNNNGASPGDGFYLRRARLIFDGTLWGAYSFRIEPEFGSRTGGAGGTSSTTATLANANVNINYWEPLQLQLGRFKGPVGYERSQLVANSIWIENGLTQNLTTQYTQGALFHGDIDHNLVAYGAGVMDDVRDNANGDVQALIDNNYSFIGDLYFNPFVNSDLKDLKGLGFGVAGSIGNRGDVGTAANSTLATYVTPGQTSLLTYNTTAAAGQTVTESEDGPGYRLAPVVYYYDGPVGAYADYAVSSIRALRTVSGAGAGTGSRTATLTNEAWQVVGSYVLTGENASYTGVVPRNNFSLKNHDWGAFQLVARYGQLTLDNDYFTKTGASKSVNDAFATGGPRITQDIGVGLNWYLNPNIKAQIQYDYTSFTGGPSPVNAQNEDQNSILTQFQLAF